MDKLKITDRQREELHQQLDSWLDLADLDAVHLKMTVYRGEEVNVRVFFRGEVSDTDFICTELEVMADACRTMDTPKSQRVLPYLETGIRQIKHSQAQTTVAGQSQEKKAWQ